jgi:hypothetical protein
MNAILLERRKPLPITVDEVEARILALLSDETVIGLDALVEMMPEYSWNQVFHAVDQLARRRSIVLRRHGFEYTLFSNSYAA